MALSGRRPLRLLVLGCVPVLLIAGGATGYHFIEGWPWFDALYATVITLTSIGYTDKHSLSITGRTFTMALALGGISTVAIAATELLGAVVTGEVRDMWERRRMRKRIGALRGHVIVCGFGRTGRQVCTDLAAREAEIVVVERREDRLALARGQGLRCVLGDASLETTLQQAGIERAGALIAVAGHDSDSVLITMTARLLVPSLVIVARAEDAVILPKLVNAGATHTICPQGIVSGKIVQAVLPAARLEPTGGVA